ncbi:NitT/TauT family transport system ATP-binding protein [Streptomyces sp. V4I8]|uniref:ABC transporter ATP-binding protein n=1 Tax=Streptomyces sp. V4I8 TaxID=3156469 RepID=UPI003515D5B3
MNGFPASAAPAPAAPILRLTGTTKRFADTLVLDRIDLALAEGEFICLIGASGCGKSTLLSLMAGLDKPTSGTVWAGSARPALMFQDHALFPWLTAGQNIELALELRGMPRRHRTVEARRLLRMVRLDGAHGKRIHELSGGMRQRVALARALAQDSRILLMDEPFAALDAITRDMLHEVLDDVRAHTPVSVAFVTHNVREAVRLGDRVLLFSSRPGRVTHEWPVDIPRPRRIEDRDVADLAGEITEHLRKEIRRHVS